MMKELLNTLSNPGVLLFPLLLIILYLISKPGIWFMKFGAVFMGGMGLLLAYSMFDSNFQKLVSEPDRLPAGALLFLFPFFLWVGLSQAHENDRRTSRDAPPVERGFREKVATWPDLVYIELITMVLLTTLLIVWSLLASAPLEEWANPASSPNPSKAPWYFLGLQELLIYFDPWIAGVIIPLLIIFGLMAIPYIDSSPAASGYYSFSGRKFATLFFLGGFIFWITLIIIGTFLRGQSWSFYGPFENRELIKHDAVNLINLSDLIWKKFLSTPPPAHWLPREIFGIGLTLFYLIYLPLALRKLAKKRVRNGSEGGVYRRIAGLIHSFKPARGQRHMITILLLFLSGGILLKIFLRLMFHIKYLVYIPEYLLNI